MGKLRRLSNDYKLTARSVREVCDAVASVVRDFGDERRVRFRGRKLGAEAVLNVAAWHFAELPRERQDELLREYLPRLESHLLPADDPADLPPAPIDIGNYPPAAGKGRRQGAG